MKSVKINECVIDFYRLIDTVGINQSGFTDFYRLIYRFVLILRALIDLSEESIQNMRRRQ